MTDKDLPKGSNSGFCALSVISRPVSRSRTPSTRPSIWARPARSVCPSSPATGRRRTGSRARCRSVRRTRRRTPRPPRCCSAPTTSRWHRAATRRLPKTGAGRGLLPLGAAGAALCRPGRRACGGRPGGRPGNCAAERTHSEGRGCGNRCTPASNDPKKLTASVRLCGHDACHELRRPVRSVPTRATQSDNVDQSFTPATPATRRNSPVSRPGSPSDPPWCSPPPRPRT